MATSNKTDSVKIETLQIRNFKRVRVAEVTFGPNGLTVIGGANGQGKSSFLSAIAGLLGGAKYTPTAVHNTEAGGATAVTRCKLSNGIEVERSGKSHTLKVTVNGEKGNQSTLNEFLNEFALDVSRFIKATDKEKAKMLIQHLGATDKLEALETRIGKLEGERTIVGREVTRKESLAKGLPTYDQAPAERVEVMSLMQQSRKLEAENRAHEEEAKALKGIREKGIATQEKIAKLREELATAEAEVEELKREYLTRKAAHDQAPIHDLSGIEKQIQDSESLNMMYEANAKAKAAAEEAEVSAKEYRELTDKINEGREQRTALITSLPMPLPGLAVEEGELLLNGQKWDCMSDSERLRVATAISRAFRPECGFVLVDQLERLDWKTLQEFDSWARAEGIQIIGAMVCDEDKAGENVIIIEDGRVKE